MNFQDVSLIAKNNDWRPVESKDDYMVSYAKDIDGYSVRLNVWIGKKGVTVGTYLKHPKQGRTQLFRRWVDKGLIEEIFQNPRVHTGIGYR